MVNTDEIDGRWIVEFVPTGETYTDADGNVKERKTCKFIERIGDASVPSGGQVPF
jgi:hypothetical protein